ncbi:ABC transporter permease [Asticcacaulis sp. YBE204]|uniref:ABC transporter permease n=1 Tax=Asticcacaulis sp. YBE204 TaxID=1282363 RepID=UPI0003C3C7A0|nr:ABC transporter permease [Asticcacaulis sp. YBE204]ESQ80383.1 hypothetical protein AEYBE204_03720 [Asticcacaulis sp. YBE204]
MNTAVLTDIRPTTGDRIAKFFLGLRGFVIPILALVAWQLASQQGAVQAYVFVPLDGVFKSLIEHFADGEIPINWLASLGRTASGFAIGGLLGVSLGALMATFRPVDVLVNPIYQAIRQVPLLGYIPLISLWFGNGEPSKLLIISLAAFYPTVLNTYEGLKHIDARHVAVGRIFLASRWQTFRHIVLPGALPSVFTGLMQAVAFTWLSSVGSELFFNPGPGLGNMMANGQAAFRMEVVLLAVIIIGVTGYVTNLIVSKIADRVLRWRNVR